jgi:GTP pyrophosphokinase
MVSIGKGLRRRSVPPPVRPRKVSLDDIVEQLRGQGRLHDEEQLRSAYAFSAEMHEDQTRRSGEPYLTHPLYVAYLLAGFRGDQTTVAVGLLHDVLEDTLTTRKALADRFGEEIAVLVDGVTKIGRHTYVRRDEAQAETFRKLVLASVKDIRVILVKLADRLHNMMTLEHMDRDTRRRIARETLEIYAPIAHRLGMSKVQGDLEDLAFYHLYPLQFAELEGKVAKKLKGGRAIVEETRQQLERLLAEAEITATISFRVKRLYSIHQKLHRQGLEVGQLYDYLAFRIVTEDLRDCYAALGVVHQAWSPVPGRFKDYIAMPKPNLYQSLHTTLVGKSGQPFEVQIRTREMDAIAEEGIAAHWSYKEKGEPETAKHDVEVAWLRQVLEWQQEVEDPRTFLSTLKLELYPEEVYAFTPKGAVLSFPRGATPLDFAYRIHTELGHQCAGARVNGKLVPLRTPLKNGDLVEILTNPNGRPSRDWLGVVATSRAKSKIRQWLNTEQKRQSVEIGRRLLEREIKKHKVAPKRFYASERLEQYLSAEGLGGVDDLLSRIGFGKVQTRSILKRVLSDEELATSAEPPSRLRKAVTKILPFGGESAITVRGDSDLLAYLAKCCNPLPGEEIVGYVTRGKGVSVHSAECANVKNLLYNPDREIQVEWASGGDQTFPVALLIETVDKPGMLADLTEVISKVGGNIRHFEAETIETGRGLIEVLVEVGHSRQFEKLRDGLRAVEGVQSVRRLRGGRGAGRRRELR